METNSDDLGLVHQELLNGGLHEESVDRLLEHYRSMQGRLTDGEYDEAGTHIGNFCENIVNILRDKMGEGVQPRPKVGDFVNDCTSGQIGNNEPDSIRLQIPRILRAAYDIRNNRDSVHVNLQVSVNRADTQAGIAMCSWMLAEILRVYGVGNGTEDMEQVANLIDEISEPVTDANPLENLVTSHNEFDRQVVADTLNGIVQIHGSEIYTDSEFDSLDTDQQVIALMIARRVAGDLGYVDVVEASRTWFARDEFADVTPSRISQIIKDYSFILPGDDSSSYQIPGFRLQEAIGLIENDEN